MAPLDLSRWDPAELAARWRDARPFPHVILDDLVPAAELQELREAVAREPHFPVSEEFFEHMASANTVEHARLRAFHDALGAAGTRAFVEAVSGKKLSAVEMRSYVYLAGSYLLPHTDSREGGRRSVSYAYYLVGTPNHTGGELDLYECELEGRELAGARPTVTIEAIPNRLVLFDVSPLSLHQVREVTSGGRVSLAGWYLS